MGTGLWFWDLEMRSLAPRATQRFSISVCGRQADEVFESGGVWRCCVLGLARFGACCVGCVSMECVCHCVEGWPTSPRESPFAFRAIVL